MLVVLIIEQGTCHLLAGLQTNLRSTMSPAWTPARPLSHLWSLLPASQAGTAVTR